MKIDRKVHASQVKFNYRCAPPPHYGARAFVSQIELFLYNNCHTDDAIEGDRGLPGRRCAAGLHAIGDPLN